MEIPVDELSNMTWTEEALARVGKIRTLMETVVERCNVFIATF